MEILFITPSDKVGGGNRVMFELAARLARSHRVSCAFPRSPAVPKYRLPPGITTKALGIKSRSRYAVLANLGFLFRWLAENMKRFDAVVSTGQITGVLLPYLRHPRLFNFIQTDEYAIFEQGHLQGRPFLYRIYSRLMDRSLTDPGIRFIFNSSFTHRIFTTMRPGRPADRIIIHPGVDPAVFYPGGRRPLGQPWRISSLVRGHALKGLNVLLAAYGSLSAEARSSASWSLITNDPLHNMRIPPEFAIHRPQDDGQLSQLLRDTDIFLSTSLWEGFGLPALEAMACGCAVITSRNGGCDEYAVDGSNCLTYQPDDHLALAGLIKRLMEKSDLAPRLAANGIRTARRFNWEASADKLLALLEAA